VRVKEGPLPLTIPELLRGGGAAYACNADSPGSTVSEVVSCFDLKRQHSRDYSMLLGVEDLHPSHVPVMERKAPQLRTSRDGDEPSGPHHQRKVVESGEMGMKYSDMIYARSHWRQSTDRCRYRGGSRGG
jgi:hypothetical protein